MADTYRLIAGVVIFVIFIGTATFMLSGSFPDIAPSGVPNASNIKQISEPTFTAPTCVLGSGDWGCQFANLVYNIVNGVITAFKLGGLIIGLFGALLTFQIPAFQANIFTQLINAMISIPLVVVLGLFIFRLLKSIIPFEEGDID